MAEIERRELLMGMAYWTIDGEIDTEVEIQYRKTLLSISSLS